MPSGRVPFTAVVGMVAVERLAELVISSRNLRWSRAHGGVEQGRGHYPAMVALHVGLLAGCLAEPRLRGRGATPVGLSAGAVLVAAQGLRWWCIRALGRQWNTRVVVVPSAPLVTGGPYRWLRHPNYVAVAAEGLALPLAAGARVTAAAFTVLDAVLLLGYRIPTEQRALELHRR